MRAASSPGLEALHKERGLPASLVESVRARHVDRLAYVDNKADGDPGHAALMDLNDELELQLLAAERDTVNELHRRGELEREPRRRIERDLDMREARVVNLKDES